MPLQPGFGGFILLPSLLQIHLPLTHTAAAMKIVLGCLSAVVAYFLAQQFSFKFSFLAAIFILVNLVFNSFGWLGLFFTGKDSAFAMLMLLASIASLRKEQTKASEKIGEYRVDDSGLFMSTSLLFGAVAAPYLLTFWLIYLLTSFGKKTIECLRQFAWCAYPLTLEIIAVHSYFNREQHFGLNLVALLLSEVVLLLISFHLLRKINFSKFDKPGLERLTCFLPLIFFCSTIFLLPATAHIRPDYYENKIVYESLPPLDGLMTAFGFFYHYAPSNNSWIATIALLVSCFLPILLKTYRSPFYIALFSFLPLSITLALGHLHLNLGILPDFNIWDITKDTVLWGVGVFSGLFSLLGFYELFRKFRRYAGLLSVSTAYLFLLIGIHFNFSHFKWLLMQPKTHTASGTYFNDQEKALAMDYLWRQGCNSTIFVRSNSIMKNQLANLRELGCLKLDPDNFNNPAFTQPVKKEIYLTDLNDLVEVIDFAKQEKANIEITYLGRKDVAVKLWH